ncbi:hypothetical protein C8J57DRAFT_1529066 [Mycena rebaudengoi]|nr:hypothetical protein C8J57DRAFT_1529066 [Mycena rebaudengoi]
MQRIAGEEDDIRRPSRLGRPASLRSLPAHTATHKDDHAPGWALLFPRGADERLTFPHVPSFSSSHSVPFHLPILHALGEVHGARRAAVHGGIDLVPICALGDTETPNALTHTRALLEMRRVPALPISNRRTPHAEHGIVSRCAGKNPTTIGVRRKYYTVPPAYPQELSWCPARLSGSHLVFVSSLVLELLAPPESVITRLLVIFRQLWLGLAQSYPTPFSFLLEPTLWAPTRVDEIRVVPSIYEVSNFIKYRINDYFHLNKLAQPHSKPPPFATSLDLGSGCRTQPFLMVIHRFIDVRKTPGSTEALLRRHPSILVPRPR